MPLSWNEIRNRALEFSKEWEGESAEHAEAKSFWDGFFNIFGITRRRIASFERHVKKIDGKDGYIDLLWKGVLLVEHKSKGKKLSRAHEQALDYFPGLKERELPRYIIVSDFERFRLYDLDEDTKSDFTLNELHKNINIFGFIAGYQTHKIKEEDPVNIKAAERMGELHDQMKESGYVGHELEIYLVRLLFCMFAEDTGIFERQQFEEYILLRTNEDGSDLGYHLDALFYLLNNPHEKRLTTRDEQLAAFPYVDGKLFEERLRPAAFDSKMRETLLECCDLDWSRISPAIFGSLFQSIMDKEARRNLGAHYTSEVSILKLINPLFMDNLRNEFKKLKKNKKSLIRFQEKLRNLNFLDPACGCGNFLVIAYRELRLLELDVLRELHKNNQMSLDIDHMILIDVDQFYGIEIEEFPAQIAQVALWLMDHQMNLLVSEEFGMYFARLPLKKSPNIVNDNAISVDWEKIIKPNNLSYIIGNPPYVGKYLQTDQQKKELVNTLYEIKKANILDYVACWYYKASSIMEFNKEIETAFVSTNSITQGEQAGILWSYLFDKGLIINFAHRTFEWTSEARGKAAVHVVLIGFSFKDRKEKHLFDYETIKADPHLSYATNINQYLVDAPNIIIESRRKPISNVLPIIFGSMPNDGGNLLLSPSEKDELLKKEPLAKKCLKRFYGSTEFLNNKERWCLWLTDISPNEIKDMSNVLNRIEGVKQFRLKSRREATRKLALTPMLFGEIRQPNSGNYLLIPRHSSQSRIYIPIGYMSYEDISGDANLIIPNASLKYFGVLSSSMHMAWVRAICGRIKSDYRYSANIVYNNFPWPLDSDEKVTNKIEQCAEHILDVRSRFKKSTLADLYNPLTMPPLLLKAHQNLDKSVDKAYGKSNFNTEAERVAFLFELYGQQIGLLH